MQNTDKQKEINIMKRVSMSLADMEKCLAYINELLSTKNNLIAQALEEAIIISYVRPFSNYSNYHEVKDLKQEFKKTSFTNEEIHLHDRVKKYRNSLIAHSDAKTYNIQLNVFELNSELKMVLPRKRRYPTLLSEKDLELLKSCCNKIKNYLYDEQVKLQNILPVGTYH